MDSPSFWSQQRIQEALAGNEMARRHVHVDPDIMAGVPVVAGTRIPVYLLLEFIEAGRTIDQIKQEYPSLTSEQIKGAIEFATAVLAIC